MSIYGKTKGTALEQIVEQAAKAESDGAMIYQFLARMAREQGLPDVAKKFYNIAMQESIHSGFFSAYPLSCASFKTESKSDPSDAILDKM